MLRKQIVNLFYIIFSFFILSSSIGINIAMHHCKSCHSSCNHNYITKKTPKKRHILKNINNKKIHLPNNNLHTKDNCCLIKTIYLKTFFVYFENHLNYNLLKQIQELAHQYLHITTYNFCQNLSFKNKGSPNSLFFTYHSFSSHIYIFNHNLRL